MTQDKEYNVVVTSFGPFSKNKHNPTQDVKRQLPDRIELPGRAPIRILKVLPDFRNYITDMDIVPKLWSGQQKVYNPDCEDGEPIHVDAMVHMGMNGADFWTIEKLARRDGYNWVGDDGVPLPKHNGGEGERWEGLPEVLETSFNVDNIVERIREDLPSTSVKPSTDAGFAYCEFITYTSLAELYKRKEKPRALFFHHAGKKNDPAGIDEGAKVAVSLICHMIDELENEGSEH
ncbi:hypothetical protein BX600DRAFT_523505 [Xylariales sp. PMI_506]|nr:hypothetical protein BX600DRAFT_523505 [Xylariales sp. PMI_506]